MHKVYFISGLGANHKAFERLDMPKGLNIKHIQWIIPQRRETIESYTLRMAEQIHDEKDFSLIGLSFGAIIAQEMSRIVCPKKTVIISAIKNRSEIPFWMKAIAVLQIHRLVPTEFFTSNSVLSYAFFRKIKSNQMPPLNRYFDFRDHRYLRWSIDRFLNWKPKSMVKNLIHIHGTEDMLFPISKINHPIRIEGGGHLMILSRAKEISKALLSIFS